MPGAPHPRFPVKLSGFRAPHAPFLKERRKRGPVQCSVQEIRGISLVFREMWDTANLEVRCHRSSEFPGRAAASHISRKTSEMWGTQLFVVGTASKTRQLLVRFEAPNHLTLQVFPCITNACVRFHFIFLRALIETRLYVSDHEKGFTHGPQPPSNAASVKCDQIWDCFPGCVYVLFTRTRCRQPCR